MIRIGFLGDLIGRPARFLVTENLQKLKERFDLDFVIVNSENLSNGFGVNYAHAKVMLEAGANVMTGGNHSWDQNDAVKTMEDLPILRPFNLFKDTKGIGYRTFEIKTDEFLTVINLMGYFSMPMVNNPFTEIEELISKLEEEFANKNHSIFIDFHAESTAEKTALFHMLKGRVAGILGTHTHIGTSDFLILENTSYLTDIGATGCIDGVIGFSPAEPIYKFKTGMKKNFKILKPDQCIKTIQMAVLEIENNQTQKGFIFRSFADKKSLELISDRETIFNAQKFE